MEIVLLVLIGLLVVGIVAMVGRIASARRAHREVLRERLGTEVDGHRQELEANAARARELSEAAAAQHERAERFRRAATEADHSAEELAQSSERARAAALRHDERARTGERDLSEL
jgi:methyl-accepting chemotaxis protein